MMSWQKAFEFELTSSYSQGPYYCGVGAGKVVLRHVVDAHYKACLCKLTQLDTLHPLNNG